MIPGQGLLPGGVPVFDVGHRRAYPKRRARLEATSFLVHSSPDGANHMNHRSHNTGNDMHLMHRGPELLVATVAKRVDSMLTP